MKGVRSTYSRAMNAIGLEDRGLTLVELLVTMMLAAILGGSVLSFVIVGFRGSEKTNNRNHTTGDLTIAINSMTQTLQFAFRNYHDGSTLADPRVKFMSGEPLHYQFAVNSGREATFYSTTKSYGNALIHWYIDEARRLIQEIHPCTSACWSTWDYVNPPTERKVLAENIRVPADNERAIFTWYNTLSTNPLNTSTAKQITTHIGVVGVYLSLTMHKDPTTAPTTFENFVTLASELSAFNNKTEWTAAPSPTQAPPAGTCTNCNGTTVPTESVITSYWVPTPTPQPTLITTSGPVPPRGSGTPAPSPTSPKTSSTTYVTATVTVVESPSEEFFGGLA